MARPFLKWVGGKTQLLPSFETLYPPRARVGRYLEPFMGSGAVFFHIQGVLGPKAVVLSDNNPDLVHVFKSIRDDVEAVIQHLAKHKKQHSERHYYEVRDRLPKQSAARAARLIYLNKTCYNGLYRVNSRGKFNVPIGRYKNPGIVDPDKLREASRCLQEVTIEARHFRETASHAQKGDFIYFDPPYHPVSETAYFTSYTEGNFGPADQEELADVYATLARRGCLVMLSNSNTPFVRDLYKDFDIRTVNARRNINSNAKRRGPVKEVVVLNY